MKKVLLFLLLINLLVSSTLADCTFDSSTFNWKCVVECKDVDYQLGQLPGHEAARVADENYHLCDQTIWDIEFNNCNFPNGTIDETWWPSDVIDKPTFFFITFSDCNLHTIQDGTFANEDTFKHSLTTFTIKDSKVFNTMTSGMFEGLNSNPSFTLTLSNNVLLQSIGPNTFAPIFESFDNVKIENTGFENPNLLASILGICQTTKLEKFTSVELLNMTPGFGIPVLSRKYFTAIASNVTDTFTSIVIDNSGLNYFEDHTVFDDIATILYNIVLPRNNLKYIPVGLFDSINQLSTKPTVHISIQDNPWHCDCNLQYAQDIFNGNYTTKLFLKEQTLCATPPSQAGKPILEADLSVQCDPPFVHEPLDIIC